MTIEDALLIERLGYEACEEFSREFPDEGIGTKDSLLLGARALMDEGLADTEGEGVEKMIDARKFLAGARALMAPASTEQIAIRRVVAMT